MLNLNLGSALDLNGKTCILTPAGVVGHAVYGPYLHLEPGDYAVEFNLSADGELPADGDGICAEVDVVADYGRMPFALHQVMLGSLRGGPVRVQLPFHTDVPQTFEFRVATNGRVPLLIEDYCRTVRLEPDGLGHADVFANTAFPDPSILPKPEFFQRNAAQLRRLHELGAAVKILDGHTVVTIDGVSFNARVDDDLRFIGEIFFRSTYNFRAGTECCVIDVGMNIGLVALTFASRDYVKEVHSFEPFRGTYERACANLRLNPAIAAKVTAHNFGLAGEDLETTVLIYDESDSGAFSIRGSDSGTPEPIVVRNAADVLRPIIEAARSKGRRIIAKVDCEGSEFPIFKVLERAGLMGEFSAFMVEWHAAIDGQTQHDLIAPLLRHGFIAFDVSPKTGNGFFYAVRAGG